jgi:UDP-N-acetyl-2-amino-2-deoxyglucuronate dehydrogenase
MAEPLGVAIVGAGVIARVHARVCAEHPALRVSTVVGRSPERAAALADEVAGLGSERPLVLRLDEALRRPEVDVVVVTTPSGSHADIAEPAVHAGKHVVIEKPVDVDLRRARRIAQIADEARGRGRLVTVVSQHRFTPAIETVRRAVDAGGLGRVTSATATVAWWRDQAYYDSGDWRGTWEHDGGGALTNQGAHTLDLLLHLLGRPEEVFGWTGLLAHERVEVEDVAAAVVRFESGALASLLVTTAAYPENATRLQVHGSAGSAWIQDGRLEYLHTSGDWSADGGGSDLRASSAPDGEPDPAAAAEELLTGLSRQWSDVVRAVADGGEPAVTVAQAVDVLALSRAVYVSQVTGAPVRFADVLRGDHDDVVLRTGPSNRRPG